MDPFRLDDEIALVTGGGTGLGFGIARCFVQAGAKVVLVGRREEELQIATAALGEASSYVVQDITDFDRTRDLLARAEEQAAGPLSILVNNAGNHFKRLAIDTSPADFDSILQTHVVAAHALSQAALPGMIGRGHGSLLFTASMTSFIGQPLVAAYAAAKCAYLGMVRTYSSEVASQGVRVNAIAPGWIESPMLHSALDNDPPRKAKILGRIQMGGFGEVDDIGLAAVFLCSPAAKYVTGVVLPVDGGASIGF